MTLYVVFQGRLNNVVGDMVIQAEKEIPPAGYTLLEKTVDSCKLSGNMV